MRFWLGWWALSMTLWLLLTSTVAGSEAVVGAGASAIAATFAELTREQVSPRFRPRPRWVADARRLPWQIVSDTVLVFVALWGEITGTRRVRGSLREVPFHHGGDRDPRASARRALAEIGVTTTPNTIALGVDPERDALLVHELVRRPGAVERLLGRAP
jgi:multisubunit Na+/H+ antiporter MnhE subunit